MNVFTPPPILQKCFFLIGNLMLFQIKKCLHQFSIAKLVKIQDGRQFYKKYMIFKKIAKSFFAKEKNTKIWANVHLYMFFDMRKPFMALKNNFDQCKWQKIQDGRQNLAFCRFFYIFFSVVFIKTMLRWWNHYIFIKQYVFVQMVSVIYKFSMAT